MNSELPNVQAGYRKGRGTRDQIANICWIIKKAREFQQNIYFCFISVKYRTSVVPIFTRDQIRPYSVTNLLTGKVNLMWKKLLKKVECVFSVKKIQGMKLYFIKGEESNSVLKLTISEEKKIK